MHRVYELVDKYIARGYRVRILSGTRIEVTDPDDRTSFRVDNIGREIVGQELANELAHEKAWHEVHSML